MDSDNDSDSIVVSHATVARSPTKRISPKTTPDDLDAQLKQTLVEIEQVDSLLQDLNERKSKLIKKYDQLKEAKMHVKSKALSNENWHEGKKKCLTCVKIIINLIITWFRILRMVPRDP